jgi:hypothetical protein
VTLVAIIICELLLPLLEVMRRTLSPEPVDGRRSMEYAWLGVLKSYLDMSNMFGTPERAVSSLNQRDTDKSPVMSRPDCEPSEIDR